jgi:dsDNA-specific endonuclease/ATPase MutS2
MSGGHDESGSASDELVVVVPIEEALDLHGFRPRDVPGVVDAYLDAALEAGFHEVRLIHGRGKGVQRARIHQILSGDPRVVRFAQAPPQRGGWGATLVWLLAPPAAESSPDEAG